MTGRPGVVCSPYDPSPNDTVSSFLIVPREAVPGGTFPENFWDVSRNFLRLFVGISRIFFGNSGDNWKRGQLETRTIRNETTVHPNFEILVCFKFPVDFSKNFCAGLCSIGQTARQAEIRDTLDNFGESAPRLETARAGAFYTKNKNYRSGTVSLIFGLRASDLAIFDVTFGFCTSKSSPETLSNHKMPPGSTY